MGIVGTGGMAHQHAEQFAKQKGVELASCLDVVPGRAEAFAHKHGVARVAASFDDLLQQLEIGPNRRNDDIRVHFGGPVEQGRGFVLHSSDYLQSGTMRVDDQVALTATLDILKEMAAGGGPRRSLLALGYAGWGPGQLDAEIQANGWLSVPADEELLFDDNLDDKWERAITKIGVDFSKLSGDAGHA